MTEINNGRLAMLGIMVTRAFDPNPDPDPDPDPDPEPDPDPNPNPTPTLGLRLGVQDPRLRPRAGGRRQVVRRRVHGPLPVVNFSLNFVFAAHDAIGLRSAAVIDRRHAALSRRWRCRASHALRGLRAPALTLPGCWR